jgi:hypothetical protein
MRIIEGRDYYDSALGFGQDPTLVWVRHPEVVKYKLTKVHDPRTFPSRRQSPGAAVYPFPSIPEAMHPKSDDLYINQYMIGFCGLIYPMLKLGVGWDGKIEAICYTLAEVDQFIEANFKERKVEAYKAENRRWYEHHGHHWMERYRRAKLEKFFNECEEKKAAFNELFVAKRCPVFVARYRYWNEATITYHAQNLKELDFMRIFDPFTAYQEIAMYFGNMAVPLRPIPPIDDKTMSEAKGFDKFSFRKDPQKKR